MKYVSMDIESTGLLPDQHQVLQIGAVIEDTNHLLPIDELPRFQCIIEHPVYVGQPMAITINQRIFQILASMEKANSEERFAIRKTNNIVPAGIAARSFAIWLETNGFKPEKGGHITINVAGKNFGTFDKPFLERLPSWGANIRIRSRIIDPSVYFVDWKKDDSLPSLATCKERAFIAGEVSHDAVEDAIDVIKVMRKATRNYTR